MGCNWSCPCDQTDREPTETSQPPYERPVTEIITISQLPSQKELRQNRKRYLQQMVPKELWGEWSTIIVNFSGTERNGWEGSIFSADNDLTVELINLLNNSTRQTLHRILTHLTTGMRSENPFQRTHFREPISDNLQPRAGLGGAGLIQITREYTHHALVCQLAQPTCKSTSLSL